jgi:hypothetical protein
MLLYQRRGPACCPAVEHRHPVPIYGSPWRARACARNSPDWVDSLACCLAWRGPPVATNCSEFAIIGRSAVSAHQGFRSPHKPGIQHGVVMIVAVTHTMERTPKHSLRLVEAAPSRYQPLLDLGDCTMRAVLWSLGLRPIPNTKTAPAADFAVASEHYAGAPVAAGADHPSAAATKVQGCGGEPDFSTDPTR